MLWKRVTNHGADGSCDRCECRDPKHQISSVAWSILIGARNSPQYARERCGTKANVHTGVSMVFGA
jgi:hypothetical protein